MTDKMRAIVKRVAAQYSVSYGHIVADVGQRAPAYQTPRVQHARHVAMLIVRRSLGASYPAIGRFFRVDHTSAMYACKKLSGTAIDNSLANGFTWPLEREGNA